MIKFILYPLLAILVLVSMCMHTIPDREMHMQEIEVQVSHILKEGSIYGVKIPDNIIAKIQEEEHISVMLRQQVVVEEHQLLSLGKIVTSDNEYILSVGILGNVIVLPKEGISEKVFLKLREKKIID